MIPGTHKKTIENLNVTSKSMNKLQRDEESKENSFSQSAR